MQTETPPIGKMVLPLTMWATADIASRLIREHPDLGLALYSHFAADVSLMFRALDDREVCCAICSR